MNQKQVKRIRRFVKAYLQMAEQSPESDSYTYDKPVYETKLMKGLNKPHRAQMPFAPEPDSYTTSLSKTCMRHHVQKFKKAFGSLNVLEKSGKTVEIRQTA